MIGWRSRAQCALAKRSRRRLAVGVALAVALGACGSSSHRAVPPTSAPTTTRVPASTTTTATTVPGPQVSGARTVLSPVGLNVRAHPATSAAVLATAARGTVLTVLANNHLGWLEVKGATVTGWISDSDTLSAPGRFSTYTSALHQFSALYPVGWKDTEAPPVSVVFRAPVGPDSIVVTTGATVAALGSGRSGYRPLRSEQILVCGVTSHLNTFIATSAPAGTTTGGAAVERYLAQVLVTIDAQHALGINANLTDVATLATVSNFANSVTFPFPVCEG